MTTDVCKSFYGIEKSFFSENGRKCGYTSGEIAQQPLVWDLLCDVLTARKGDILAFMEKLGDLSKLRIILTGAGSSAFVGDALSVLAAKIAGIRVESIHTTDIVSSPDSYLFPDVPTLLVSFARSGNSPESSGAVNCARQIIKDLFEAVIVCDGTSALFELSAHNEKCLTLVMPELSNDKGFAMTSSVSCMQLAGFALLNYGKIDDIIRDISLLSKNVAGSSPVFTKTALKLARTDFDRIAYLGSGFTKHLAHEASLKMMELTNGIVNGSYESATGFRHGPKSVVNSKTMTVHMIPNDRFTAQYDLDLLSEIYRQKKENTVIAVGVGIDIPCDEIVTVESEGYGIGADICTGLQTLVFCQMLAMFKSLELGVMTDNPSPDGEVNRVVKGVIVYPYAGKTGEFRLQQGS